MKSNCALVVLMIGMLALTTSTDAQQRKRRNKRTGDRFRLHAAEMAPNFVLKSLDGSEETDLSSFRGKKPVVLFFGSYT